MSPAASCGNGGLITVGAHVAITTLDGLDNNDNSIRQVYQPTVCVLTQVTVLGGDYSDEYGRAGGAS